MASFRSFSHDQLLQGIQQLCLCHPDAADLLLSQVTAAAQVVTQPVEEDNSAVDSSSSKQPTRAASNSSRKRGYGDLHTPGPGHNTIPYCSRQLIPLHQGRDSLFVAPEQIMTTAAIASTEAAECNGAGDSAASSSAAGDVSASASMLRTGPPTAAAAAAAPAVSFPAASSPDAIELIRLLNKKARQDRAEGARRGKGTRAKR
ncbi:unnamed protein product [Vitrella brassicaformis CCMP3155]|uniref:Uncharacterized protein n=1 Tax=Vitrella brassicaformis (strain CCMP3155) TaxID=1169540 RepID=A0A0G4EGL8_VITBC|nr:unnamed protein product [Vitrella brassicaformis CCMP3155]|eukprot:CEL94630.1 unnamed protein product [Vitrella brassicaformis CCMP3155]